MAIKLTDKPNTKSPDGEFPYGNVRDRDGALPGTPGNTLVHGDFHQFFEKLMDFGSIVHNGVPDNEYDGYQLFEALEACARLFLASTTEKGAVEIATQSEMDAGTDTSRSLTPELIKDSYRLPQVYPTSTSNKLYETVVPIGDWDMSNFNSATVTYSLESGLTIVGASAIIRDDSGDNWYPLDNLVGTVGGVVQAGGWVDLIDSSAGEITLYRFTDGDANTLFTGTVDGFFVSSNFNSTSYNRGYVIIKYIKTI